MNELPYFRLYAAQLLADENIAQFTDEEVGCWVRLLCYAWCNGSIPSDPERVARLLHRHFDADDFEPIWQAISGRFVPSPDDPERLISRRLEQERGSAEQAREDKIRAGIASGQARRGPKPNSVPEQNEQRSNGVQEQEEQRLNAATRTDEPLPTLPNLPTNYKNSLERLPSLEQQCPALFGFLKALDRQGASVAAGKASATWGKVETLLGQLGEEAALEASLDALARRKGYDEPPLAYLVPVLEAAKANGKPKAKPRPIQLPAPDPEWLAAHPNAQAKWDGFLEHARTISSSERDLANRLTSYLLMLKVEFEDDRDNEKRAQEVRR